MKKPLSLLVLLLVLTSLFSLYGCNRIDEESIKTIVIDLTSQANFIFNFFYNPLNYDNTKESFTGKRGDIFFPVQKNDLYNSIEDIKQKCESVFTVEYCNENLYDFGFDYIDDEDFGDPVYIEKDGVLYVNSSIEKFSLEMVFDYDRFTIIQQLENEITISMDVFDYNFYPREQAIIKISKVDEDWRISFLFD